MNQYANEVLVSTARRVMGEHDNSYFLAEKSLLLEIEIIENSIKERNILDALSHKDQFFLLLKAMCFKYPLGCSLKVYERMVLGYGKEENCFIQLDEMFSRVSQYLFYLKCDLCKGVIRRAKQELRSKYLI